VIGGVRTRAVAVVLVLLAGCESSTQVVVDTTVPEATVDAIPLSVGVVYDEALTGHVYVEDSSERPQWRIETGASQEAMFRRVFADLFANVTEVPNLSAAGGLDAVIEPEIVAMQFATPAETRLEFYEAWVKYALDVRRPDGEPLARWVFTAYGKSPSGFMTRNATGINAAVEQALRAAGAKVITRFRQVPEVAAWLKAETPGNPRP